MLLKFFLLSLGAILFLLGHDLVVEKKSFAFKTHIVKYLGCLTIGTFGLSYFLKWGIAQDLLLVGGVILLGLSFNAIASLFSKHGVNVPVDGAMKMSAIINREDPNKPNANNSRKGAIAILALYAVGTVVSFFYHGLPATWEVIAAGVVAIAAAVVNFKNLFQTNDDWKTGVLVASGILTFLVYGIHFSQTAV